MRLPTVLLILSVTWIAGAAVFAQPAPPDDAAQRDAMKQYAHQLQASLRASTSPRDQALSAWVLQFDSPFPPGFPGRPEMPGDALRGAVLRKAAAAAPRDRLVQWLWASASDPLSGCTVSDPCKDRAHALARLEPDNAAAWQPVITEAARHRDDAAIDAALAHMAAASRFDELYRESISAWIDAYRRFPPASGNDGTPAGLNFDAKANARSQTGSSFASVAFAQQCSRRSHADLSPARIANCAKAARVMLDRSTTVTARIFGAGVLQASGLATPEDLERARTTIWQVEQYGRLLGVDPGNAARVRADNDLMTSSDSEFDAIQKELLGAHVPLTPPASWQPEKQGGPAAIPAATPPVPAPPG